MKNPVRIRIWRFDAVHLVWHGCIPTVYIDYIEYKSRLIIYYSCILECYYIIIIRPRRDHPRNPTPSITITPLPVVGTLSSDTLYMNFFFLITVLS